MSDARRDALKGIDRSKLEELVGPVAHAHGAEVVDIEFKQDPQGWVLRVLLEKLGAAAEKLSTEAAAIDLEVCSNVSRELSPALDATELVPHAYHLEVGTPGVERTLRGEADFVRFIGKKAKIKLHEGVAADGAAAAIKVVVGILEGVEGGVATVREGSRAHAVALSDVSSARLVFEFGPAPKPGKSGKTGSTSKPGTTSKSADGSGDPKSKAQAERSKRSV
ncbi:MAG: ribosome maturation factor RimP [Proteobacteria bacterium]|nr:MAG: ribosome maturation factor RimP [Pseudomonadota bacterium]